MNYKMISRFEAWILAIEAGFMLPALLISLFSGPRKTTLAFAAGIVIILAAAGLLALFSRGARQGFYAREGLICVSAGWILMSLFGCLPFWLSGEIPRFIDALFEMVSGFTTTGSSILSDVEVLSSGILYWRSFSHWLGGMGVLVFMLAIIPSDGKKEGFTMHLLRAESPGPDVGKLAPKMRQTAIALYLTYIVLTIINFAFLLFGDMSAFEAICTAFGTAGTGGFGVKNDSLMSYSPYIQTVTTVFMLIFGVNFSCYYLILLGRIRSVFKDEELRLYFGFVGAGIVMILLNTRHLFATVGETLRHAAFQVASIVSTTGYASVDFDLWPTFSKCILMILMVTGACAGSTAGGMKFARVLLLFKGLKRNLTRLLHPQKVQVVRVNDKAVDEKVLANANAYLSAYVIILAVSTLLVSLDGYDFMTTFSSVLTCFNNVGPGFSAVGATCNFGGLGVLSKIVLILDMWAGRLEIFPILALFGAFRLGRRNAL